MLVLIEEPCALSSQTQYKFVDYIGCEMEIV